MVQRISKEGWNKVPEAIPVNGSVVRVIREEYTTGDEHTGLAEFNNGEWTYPGPLIYGITYWQEATGENTEIEPWSS